ncbi:MAG: methionine aminopeptidase, partial [Bacteroidaceae bacterium]|nr:methionine aminopeptidase [Bacteroidaceae bacterium]
MKRKRNNWKLTSGAPVTELDKKVMFYQNKGCLVPTKSLIKTPEQIEGIRISGVINTGILDLVAEKIHAGMSTEEIDKLVYNYTIEHGAVP